MKTSLAILTSLSLSVFPAITGCSQDAAPEWRVELKVVDEAGRPVAGAAVKVWYHVPPPPDQSIAMTNKIGLTDSNGVFTASERSRTVELIFEAQKDGYYPVGKSYDLGHVFEYTPEKWNPSVMLVLKRIGQQIPMYAKRVEAQMPKENEPVGFDLVAGDWVAPFGTGTNADFLFTVQRKITSMREYDARLKLSFPNPGDGLMPLSPEPAARADGPLLVRQATAEAVFQPERVWHFTHLAQPEPVAGYYFRVRTVLDKQGKVKTALYGKLRGDIRFYAGTKAPRAGVGFTYYLNPTPNDRNVEFDPNRNLLQGLKPTERVNEP